MKKRLYLLILVLATYFGVSAQETIDINYDIVITESAKLDKSERELLRQKLESILSRCSLSGTKESPFVVVPSLHVEDPVTSTMGVRSQTIFKGELTLLVKNRYDGDAINQMSFPLTKVISTKKGINIRFLLINEIPVKNPAFVKFFRTTTKRIAKKYSEKELIIP